MHDALLVRGFQRFRDLAGILLASYRYAMVHLVEEVLPYGHAGQGLWLCCPVREENNCKALTIRR